MESLVPNARQDFHEEIWLFQLTDKKIENAVDSYYILLIFIRICNYKIKLHNRFSR